MNGLLIHYQYCSGCHSCEMACKQEHDIPLGKWGIHVNEDGPWKLDDGSWHWDYIPVPTEICDLCADRIAEGKEPSCVLHCQAKCMFYGDTKDLLAKAEVLGKKTVIFQL